jgi:hypothetical protein
MIWRSTVLILAAFLVAALAFWFAPALLDLVGLPEFGFIGQLCCVVLALSLLEAGFRRLPERRKP